MSKGRNVKSTEKDKNKISGAILNGPQVYAIGALGNWTNYDFRIGFYSDVVPDPEKGEKNVYVVNAQIMLTPRAVKELSEFLIKQVDEYEKKNGIIKTTNMLKESEKKKE